MIAWVKNRYLNVLGSIYLYNEHRGYTAIDRVIEAVEMRTPHDTELIASLRRHRKDERKHYVMFQRWFERRGMMPLNVNRSFGHIDRFIEIMFRSPIAEMETQRIVDDEAQFEKLCRVISLTEKRGYRQVEVLLRNRVVQADPILNQIFEIIRKDEPSHWEPYDGWLRRNARREPQWWERAVDSFIHAELLMIKLPLLFLNPLVRQRKDWPDASDSPESGPTTMHAAPVAE